MKNSEKSTGGLWMIVGIVAMLAIPMVIGHYTIAAAPEPTVHADAGAN